MSAYQTLERRFARLAAINDALGILQWDTETLMPPGAADGRAERGPTDAQPASIAVDTTAKARRSSSTHGH